MKLLLIISTVHFIIGGIGIVIINRRLSVEFRKKNWLKYIIYLLLYIIILASILINKNLFLGICIIILSGSIIELLKLGKQPCKYLFRDRIIFLSLTLFTILTVFFSLFILLPSALIAYTYTLVIIFDGASQISGQIAGKRKILPVLSPNKTMEGLFGGILSTVITSMILHNLGGFSILQSFIFGLIICSASFIGDMVASLYKRAFDVKDFDNILPGQGGILDRFDSFLVSGAVIGGLSVITIFSIDHIDKNIAVYFGYSIVFMLILFIGELFHTIFKIKAEFSRIFAHVSAGIVSLFMIKFFTSPWYIIALCIQSTLFLFLTKKKNLFDSHHKVKRNTYGSSIFFIGILTAYILSKITNDVILFILPIIILSISDPVASLVGSNRKSGFWPTLLHRHNNSSKTYVGSIGFFISTFFILLLGLSFYYNVTNWDLIILALVISGFTSITEAISPYGTDNLSVPLVVSVLLIIFFR